MDLEDKTNKEKLRGAIIKVVAFFDLFDCPLSLMEIWQFGSEKCDLNDIKLILDSGSLASVIDAEGGFYFLKGRTGLIRIRSRRYNYAHRKFKRAIFICRLFKIVPWIRMIALSNMIGSENMKDDGDIDLFIITESRRVWITRFFCVLILKILNWRPQPEDWRDKICLSFFISEEGMNIKNLLLNKNDIQAKDPAAISARGSINDIYFVYWLANLVPLYDPDQTYEKYIEANSWFKKILPNWQLIEPSGLRLIKSDWGNYYHDLVDLFLGGLEKRLAIWQIKIMPPLLKELVGLDTRVIINDKIIKMHSNDRREEYWLKFRNTLDRISHIE